MKENNELVVLEEVKYPVSTDEIKAFVDSWKEIPTLDPTNEDKTDYKIVKKAHLRAVSIRTTIEKKRKELKAPVIAYGKSVDGIAKEFQELINPKELELFTERNKVDQYEKDQELRRIEAEQERVENIRNAITALKMIPLDAMGKSSAELTSVYEAVEMPSEATYGERLDEAILTYKETLNKLEAAIGQARLAEDAQNIQDELDAKREEEDAAQREKLQKEQAAFREEKEAFEKKKKEQEDNNKRQQEEINKQRAEREADELLRQQEKEEEDRLKENSILLADAERETEEAIYEVYDDVGIEGIVEIIIGGLIPHVKWEVQHGE